MPSSDVLIDKGSAPTNSVYISPTELKTLNELVPQTGVGNLPDIGAIDQNNVWTPGIDWVPEKISILLMHLPNQSNGFQRRNFRLPNPTNGIVKISSENNVEYRVFDVNGITISRGYGNTIDLSSFANGVYFLKFKKQNSRVISIIKSDIFETYGVIE